MKEGKKMIALQFFLLATINWSAMFPVARLVIVLSLPILLAIKYFKYKRLKKKQDVENEKLDNYEQDENGLYPWEKGFQDKSDNL